MSLADRFRRTPTQPRSAAPDEAAEARASALLATYRGRAPIPAAPAAGKAAAAVLKPLMKGAGLSFSELQRHWAEIVGEPFSRSAAPERLVSGTLTVRAPSAVAPFLQAQAPLLIERLRLAGAQIKTIKIEQRALPAKPRSNLAPLKRPLTPEEEAALTQALDHIQDAGLKSALLRLGRAVKRR
jgi:hypothetical protein